MVGLYWMLCAGGVGIVIGAAWWSYRSFNRTLLEYARSSDARIQELSKIKCVVDMLAAQSQQKPQPTDAVIRDMIEEPDVVRGDE